MTGAASRRWAMPLPPWLAATAVGGVTLAIALAVVSPYTVGAFHDDAIYVILGRALASGSGYRYLNLPGAPSATHYPPGYPALLAVLWRMAPHFPDNIVVFERANAVLLACSAVLAYLLAHRRLGLTSAAAALVALAGTATIPPLALAGIVLSESLFLTVLLAALMAAESVAGPGADSADSADSADTRGGRGRGRWRGPASWRAAAVAGALCGAVALVRTVGFVVIPAAIVACLLRRRGRMGLVLGAAAVAVVLPWQLWVRAHSGELAPVLQGEYGTYSGWLSGALERHGLRFALATAGHNAADIVAMLESQLAPRFPSMVKQAAVAACGALVGLGLPRFVHRAPVTAGFAVLYAGEVLFWPFPPFRFVWAAWLFLVFGLVMGAATIWEWRPRGAAAPAARARRAVRGLGLTAAALVGLAVVRYNVLGYRGHWWNTMQESLSEHMVVPLAWLATHPALPDVVASDQEPAIYLYAGRLGVPCNTFTPDEYVYQRDTAHDRAILDAVLQRFPVRSVVATGPACALAALRLMGPGQGGRSLVPVDTMTPGFAVFARAAR